MRTKLATLIAKMEGFGLPHTIPTLRHNPGDLRHGPNASHDGIGKDDIGIYATDELGWLDLERQLTLYSLRGLTVRQAIAYYAPPNENNTSNYLEYICKNLPCTPDMPMSEAIKIIVEEVT